MKLEIILVVLGIAAGVAGLVWFLKDRSKVDSAIQRGTTIPSGVAQKLDSVIPGAGTAVSNAANDVGQKVTSAVDNASKV